MANEDNRPLSNASSSELVHELPNCAPQRQALSLHKVALWTPDSAKKRVPHFCAKPLDI